MSSYVNVKAIKLITLFVGFTEVCVTGCGPSVSACMLWDLGELRSSTKRDSSFPRSTPGAVPSVPTCIQ